jgi:excinuclease ABC subunit A
MRATRLRGARTHNLKRVDLDVEPGSLVAVVGPSGAGKSSLAFGTLYAEGQRRYVESFSAYARQFLERLARPPVDELDPIAASVAVDRQAPVRTSRSTVGTMTEVADYAKSLWARAATLVCPGCARPVTRDVPERIADEVLESAPDARLMVTYPLAAGDDAETFLGVREALVEQGYRRIAVDGAVTDLDELPPSAVVGKGAALDVVADRLVARPDQRARLVESLEMAMDRGGGRADVRIPDAGVFRYSRGLHCAHCDRDFRDATPGMFSFNSAVGACETCRGFGRTIGVDWDRVLPDRRKTLAGGAIRPWRGKSTAWERRYLKRQAKAAGVPLDVPVAELTDAQREWLIEGDGIGWPEGWVGLRGWFDWLQTRAYKMHVRVLLSRYRSYDLCAACEGARLKPESLWWKIDGRSIADFFALPASEALAFVKDAQTVHGRDGATALLLRELSGRLATLCDVGLEYLTLDRASRTLSGGEAQRVALTSALGASLTGALFVLDEPTVGLHPVDVARLSAVVRRLTDGDNTVLLVEHDPEMIRSADRVVELGPGAGERGGRLVFDGTPEALRDADTATGRALYHRAVERRTPRRPAGWLRLRGARGNNLRGVDLELPLGVLTCVTGVSGSGKSSLVIQTLVPAARRARGDRAEEAPLPHDGLEGAEGLSAVVHVDQSPLGRTSRGNPATYLKIWNVIRQRFADEPEAKARGFTASTFSFNTPGGRCEACGGEGAETVEMQFLADVTFSCPACGGRRFVGPVLEVTHRGLSIADVLELTVEEARARFADDAELAGELAPLDRVGLGYVRLGQPLNTLSGGEAQRLKLAGTLAATSPGSLVVLDEPTAGLHHDDVTPLLATLERLVERGDTVVVVEHDMRVAAVADHVIDLGPGAGEEGGRVVAAGTPVALSKAKGSLTAPHLALALGRRKRAPKARRKVARRRARAPEGTLTVTRAREHNLRDVSVGIPREKLVVITGPSGSGKSTLAFDVIFAEGQRRYLETLSPYARQYMPQLPRPDVDRVAGVPPTVSLEQRTTRGGANSTVATVTEVAHYLRLLWARAGLPHCPEHGEPIAARSALSIAEELKARFGERRLIVLAPVVKGRKGLHRELLTRARADGFEEARIDGRLRAIEEGMALARFEEHDVDLVVARTRGDAEDLLAAVERAAELGDGQLRVRAGKTERLLSTKRACPTCGRGFPELDPRFFSFNTRQGACPRCEGRGELARTVGRGKHRREVFEPCPACEGTRLSPLARAVTVDGRPITDVLSQSIDRARERLGALRLSGREATIAEAPLHELDRRLAFLQEVGVGYLGLSRPAHSLSGGETQRVRLAAQLGAGLTGLLYVLDEPTIGLHPRDTGRLLRALRGLVDRGNTVLVVEHDDETIRAADHVIDVGPGGGVRGGTILAEGPPAELLEHPKSVTGPALARGPLVPDARRPTGRGVPKLVLKGATMHNLRGGSARFPLGRLTAVTGVSGSGKSTLVRSVLLPSVRRELGLVAEPPGPHRALEGAEHLKRAVEVDQSPIGRTPRSVPATYVGVWNELRKLLAATPEARARGYTASRFSFNTADGRCPECKGNGALKVEMAFLPNVHLPCDACGGRRFTDETLQVKLHGLSAGEILELDLEEAARVFGAVPKVAQPLELLCELGLGYLKLGQPSNTLSGGEAQRLKLVAELGTSAQGPTLYVLDEPTTGLHRDDVQRLLRVLDRFVERGDTVVVIEHHPDVVAAADWIVDLGPEGGEGGGKVVVQGPPEKVAAKAASHTGAVLRELGLGVTE